ncbi:ATP-NAD kinase [Macrolepiota fuliginosa MF-IS2]|uniref:ATP-NAD kinase n=1 Tax=Macrolepiota fuliginosa MF-IS2 TaxID=1400762 RepID=A0A9P6C7L6_9AGAR|nr:ATP-NAD kinase [Macrolepiota fuliginosa MF-IS2]
MPAVLSRSLLSPGVDEVFSTPPTTPGPQVQTEHANQSLSRRSSRPTSLHIDHLQTGEWNTDIVLETSPVAITNGIQHLPSSRMDNSESTVVDPSSALDHHRSRSHMNSQPVSSPCFVHSHLDKGASLTDWLRTRAGANQTAISDLGVARSLQYTTAPSRAHHPGAYSPFSGPRPDQANGESDGDEDEFVGSLTKQLAETAVGVREMSKQLGRARVQSNIQSILIVTKARDNRLIKLTREIALYLMLKRRPGTKRGLVVYVDNQLRHSKRFDADGIRREHPELFIPIPRHRSSSGHSSSAASSNGSGTEDTCDEGQLRYWTSSMCSHSPHLFDFVITLGGDGTVLFTSWLFQRIVPPVLPFALGSLGFLTNFDFNDHQAVMDSAIENGIRVNLRMRFTCTVYRAVGNEDGKRRKAVKRGETGEILMKNLEQNGWEAVEGGGSMSHSTSDGKPPKDKEIMCFTTRPVEQFEVLNDLVVDRGPSPYVSQLELFGDDHHMTTVQADGLTISTPTGSTAYSLSAGGSLAHPEIPAILITPICPHTLSFRPMLLPDSMELRICVPYNSRSTAWASFDGRGRVELKQGDHIKVTASKYPFPTVCADNQSTDWFHAISRTLKWNERERQKSFVVVEEGPQKLKKRSKRANTVTPGFIKAASTQEDEILEEEDEVSSEEEDKFDIDDISGTEANKAPPCVVNTLTPQEQATAADKVRESRHQDRVVTSLKRDHRRSSKSRSRSRASAYRYPQPQVPTQPPAASPRHVDFDLPPQNDSGLLHTAQHGSRDDIYSIKPSSGKSRIPDRDLEEVARTPTATTLLHNRARAHSRSRSQDQQHGHRAFAVWGNDETDSNASDSDCT